MYWAEFESKSEIGSSHGCTWAWMSAISYGLAMKVFELGFIRIHVEALGYINPYIVIVCK